MGIPGMMLPNQGNAYQDDMGVNPMNLMQMISALQNPSLGNSPTMGNSNFQQSQQPQQNFGDTSTISGRIQEALGAKQPDQGGQIQDILAGRFQQPQPTGSDIRQSAVASALSPTPSYVPAQQFANQRLAGSMDTLSKLTQTQELQARGNMYSAMAANGGGRGEGLAAANRMMQQYNSDPDVISGKKPPLQFTQAYMMATAKQGQGITFDPVTGQQIVASGAPEAAGQMSFGKQSGTEQATLNYAGPIAAATAGARNQADIEAAGPLAANKERGEALGQANISLANMQSSLPALTSVVNDIRHLNQKATYTVAGQIGNTIARQGGLPVPQSAVARAELISKVDNVLIPTLKSMFGARVTNFDIQSTRNMLINPDFAPLEKDAQLKAFIQQKVLSIQSGKQLVSNLGGQIPAQTESNTNINMPQGARQATDGNWYLPDPNRPGKYLQVQQ